MKFKEILTDIYDRVVTQKVSTILGVILIGIGIFDQEPTTKVMFLTLGASLITSRDSFFKMRK